jgi:hypothetical protein
MLASLVSGLNKSIKTRTKEVSQTIIQIFHLQPSAGLTKPAKMGPMHGMKIANAPHDAIAYEATPISYISIIVAPPVVSVGLPKTPVKNRKTRNIGILTV